MARVVFYIRGRVITVLYRYCKPCLEKDPSRTITLKAPARKSDRKRNYQDYASLNLGLASDPNRWMRMLENKSFKQDNFKRMHGSDVTVEWLEEDEDALTEPIVVEEPTGLGMKMPPNDFSVEVHPTTCNFFLSSSVFLGCGRTRRRGDPDRGHRFVLSFFSAKSAKP